MQAAPINFSHINSLACGVMQRTCSHHKDFKEHMWCMSCIGRLTELDKDRQ